MRSRVRFSANIYHPARKLSCVLMTQPRPSVKDTGRMILDAFQVQITESGAKLRSLRDHFSRGCRWSRVPASKRGNEVLPGKCQRRPYFPCLRVLVKCSTATRTRITPFFALCLTRTPWQRRSPNVSRTSIAHFEFWRTCRTILSNTDCWN